MKFSKLVTNLFLKEKLVTNLKIYISIILFTEINKYNLKQTP